MSALEHSREIYNFGHVVWDSHSRRKFLQVTFNSWNLIWVTESSIFLIDTSDVKKSSIVSITIGREPRYVSGMVDNKKILYLFLLTDVSLHVILLESVDAGPPCVVEHKKTDTPLHPRGVAAHPVRNHRVCVWIKDSVHMYTLGEGNELTHVPVMLQLEGFVTRVVWRSTDDVSFIVLTTKRMLLLVRLEEETLKVASVTECHLPTDPCAVEVCGGKAIVSCGVPLLENVLLVKSGINMDQGDFLDIPPEKSTQNSTVEAQLVIVDHSDACSPTVQATVTIPGIIEPDIVKITSSGHIVVGSSLSTSVVVFKSLDHPDCLHTLSFGDDFRYILELFPKMYVEAGPKCYAIIASQETKGLFGHAFLEVKKEKNLVVSLVELDFSKPLSGHDVNCVEVKVLTKSLNQERYPTCGSEVVNQLPLEPGPLENHLENSVLPKLIVPQLNSRSPWNPVPALLEEERRKHSSISGQPVGKEQLLDIVSQSRSCLNSASELVSENQGTASAGVRDDRMAPSLADFRGGHWQTEAQLVKSTVSHSDENEPQNSSKVGLYPSLCEADVIDVNLSNRKQLSFLLHNGLLHLPTVRRAFGLSPDTLLTVTIGEKEAVVVEDVNGYLPLNLKNQTETLRVSELLT